MPEYLADSYGRKVSSLRMSLTNRCNHRCIYCHNEGEHGSGAEITVDEVAQIVRIAAKHGVDKVKFSGGEPLLRHDFEDILRALPPLRDVSATTNGTLLASRAKALKEAGLDRVNVSLVSLNGERYDAITRTHTGQLEKALDGIQSAVDVGLTPVKINMVYLKGVNEDELDRMIDFVKKKPLILQIIELMNFNGAFEYHGNVSELERTLRERANKSVRREMHRRTKYYVDDAEVEIVRPIDNSEFCMNCNRLRVTSDCKLKPCLLKDDDLVNVRGLTDEELEKAMRYAVSIREPFFKPLHVASAVKAPQKTETDT